MTFLQAMTDLRHWLIVHQIIRDYRPDEGLKVTIEVETTDQAVELLRGFRREVPLTGTELLDLNTPFRFMGMTIEFRQARMLQRQDTPPNTGRLPTPFRRCDVCGAEWRLEPGAVNRCLMPGRCRPEEAEARLRGSDYPPRP